jgi:predicted cupin superfamily sugar epimerase
MLTAEQLIKLLGLEPHPEGGYYRETYRSDEIIGKGANMPSWAQRWLRASNLQMLRSGAGVI